MLDEDDAYFARALDWVPLSHLLEADVVSGAHATVDPDSDNNNNNKALSKKQQKKRSRDAAKAEELAKKRARTSRFDVSSTAEIVARAYAGSNIKLGGPTANEHKGATSVSELTSKLSRKLEANRRAGGVPGARAERDKMLPAPPKELRKMARAAKRGDNPASSSASVSAAADTPPAKPRAHPSGNANANANAAPASAGKRLREELTSRISFGALALGGSASSTDAPVEAADERGARPITSMKHAKSPLSIKRLIKKAESTQARMEQLKAQGLHEEAENLAWERIERKAAGDQTQDDPKVLKKWLKRAEKQKEKSAESTMKREKAQAAVMASKQEKRQANIAARKATKKAKALAVRGIPQAQSQSQSSDRAAPKRRPGLEGAASTPLNAVAGKR